MCFNQLDQALQERCRQYTKNFMEYGKAQSDVMQQVCIGIKISFKKMIDTNEMA